MAIKVDLEDLITKKTDSRGRLTLGTDYANREVTVVVVEDAND